MSKIEDSIYGFVVGDALGVPVEFLQRNHIKSIRIEDMLGYGTHNVPPGTWSDDTSMVLATLDSICNNKNINYYDIMHNFYKWFYKGEYTSDGRVFDIGNTTYKAINNYCIKMKEPKRCGCSGDRDNGNGSLMRILPVSLYLIDNNYDEIESTNIINNVSSLTHSHEISKLGCKIYNDFVEQIYLGKDKFEAYNYIKQKNYLNYYSKYAVSVYDKILKSNIILKSESEINSSGYVVNSLESCLWAILTTDDYKSAVLKSIRLGNDTDTIGALTGGIAGLMYGKENIPDMWLSKIRNKELIEELCDKYNKLNSRKSK